MDNWINFGLGGLPLLTNAKTRSISAENPEGKVAAGAQAVPPEGEHSPAGMLGKGWKVRPCITLPANEETELANIDGPGTIRHIWITTAPEHAYRNVLLRIWWDDEDEPSVEVPLGDFFAMAYHDPYKVNSIPVVVNPRGGMNCYWPMPFRKAAKITVENQWHEDIQGFFYQITYELDEVAEKAAYFHAQWRRSMTTREYPEHVLVDGIKGKGHYVGTFMAWTQLSDGWWGEGEIKFFIDGDPKDAPTICGTGTEDYFCGAWGFHNETYSTAYLGYPWHDNEPGRVPKHALYRWHIMDPIRFEEDLRVTMQALGWWPGHYFEPLTDDIASVAYWYQSEPHAAFPEMPPREQRWSR
jgi:hypothetical protein